MGLDGVELVMAYEDAFGIAIPDAAAAEMLTPRDVIEFVHRIRGHGTRAKCLSRRAFHVVRQKLIEAGHFRKSIRPDAALEQFFPRAHRRTCWLRERDGFTAGQWPDLVRPDWLVRWLTVLVLSTSAGLAMAVSRIENWQYGFWTCLGALLVFGVCVERLTRSFQSQFPQMSTVGDLARRIAIGGTSRLLKDGELLDRENIAGIVRQITLKQLGLDPVEYSEDKEFVRDFGVD